MVFLVVVGLAPAAVAAAADRARTLLLAALEDPARRFSPEALALDVVALTVPIVAVAALAAVVTGLVQTGGVVALKRLAPDAGRANPVEGLKKLVTWQRIVSVVRALVTGVLVSWIAVEILLDHGADLAATIGDPSAAGAAAGVLALKVARWAAAVGLALALVDVVVSRRAWLKRLRMSKHEVKREHKEAEGDPEIKAARQRAHQEMLRGATIAAVKDATVVVVNPTHLAVALRYDEDRDEAPRIVAQGDGLLARQLVDAARAYGVPVVRDVPVARALSELDVGDEIPEALYETVAEILRDLWEHEVESGE